MAVDLNDYTRTAAQRGWGAGWPSCAGAKAAGTAVVTAKRSGTRVSVHKRIARLVQLLIDWTEDPLGGNYLLKPGQCGGYNCRPISGTSVASNHSWGLALDLNWNDNTYNSTGRHTLPTAVARKWNQYGFAWGGDYRGAKQDWMHLEQMGTPAEVDHLTALALTDLVASQIPASPPTPVARPTPAPSPSAAAMEDDPMVSIPLTLDASRTFQAAIGAEAGGGSQVAARGWVTFGSTFGPTTFTRVAALSAGGAVLQQWENVKVANNTNLAYPLPDGTRCLTVQGICDNAGTRPWASYWAQR